MGTILPALLRSYIKPHIHFLRAQGPCYTWRRRPASSQEGKGQAGNREVSHARSDRPEHMLPLPKATTATQSHITARFMSFYQKKLEIHIVNSKLPIYNYLPLFFLKTLCDPNEISLQAEYGL